MTTREDYVAKMKAKIDEWNAEIELLQAKARTAQADARITYEKQIAEMKEQRAEAEKKMHEARETGEKAWSDMRAGFESAWEDISTAWSNALKRFS